MSEDFYVQAGRSPASALFLLKMQMVVFNTVDSSLLIQGSNKKLNPSELRCRHGGSSRKKRGIVGGFFADVVEVEEQEFVPIMSCP